MIKVLLMNEQHCHQRRVGKSREKNDTTHSIYIRKARKEAETVFGASELRK
jgi:hypothetical protein